MSVHTTERDYYIDFAKGLACLNMAIGHTMYYTTWFSRAGWLYAGLWLYIELAMPVFILASGMNVVTQVDRLAVDRTSRPTQAFLGATLWLFLLGFVYSIARRNLQIMELFQCVAMGTAVAFIAARRRWPAWSLAALGVGAFALSAVFCYDPIPVTTGMARTIRWSPLPPQLPELFAQMRKDLVISAVKKMAVYDLPLWRRVLYIHFAFVPWVGLFLFGLLLKKLRGSKWMLGLWALAALLFAGSFLVPFRVPREDVGFYLRCKADYVGRLLLIGMLVIVPLQRWYRTGANWFKQAVELIGKESFMFFVVHWLVVWVSAIAFLPFRRFPLPLVWGVQFTVNCVGAFWLTKFFAALRDRTIKRRYYALFWSTVMFVCAALALFFESRDRGFMIQLFSAPASLAVAMIWPVGRNAIRAVAYRRQARQAG
jgi:surface polysaccharide O-acyltransferase-like enzyme